MTRVVAVLLAVLAVALGAYAVFALGVATEVIDTEGDPTALTWVLLAVAAGLALALAFAARALWRRGAAARPCPRCGRAVPVGQLECGACGFDFRTVGA